MASTTKIQWWDKSWSPITGCTPVSIGCEHCYAKRLAGRFPQIHNTEMSIFKNSFAHINFHPDRLNIPFHWRKPKRIFVCPMGDLFHPQVAYAYIGEVFKIMRVAAAHTFMVLTKRPENIASFYNHMEYNENTNSVLPNLWLGVTAENQEMFDLRWTIVSKIPAVILSFNIFQTSLFVSGEPLLGNIDFSKCNRKPDLFIVGPETGPGKRPMNLDWARSLKDQCVAAGVPFFYKGGELDGKLWQQWPVK